jgi:1,4-alpha-glucan branching enzyme
MGQEFGQTSEWNFNQSLDWHLLQYPVHQGVQALIRDLNRLHRIAPALYARDCEPEGFRWIVADDRDNSVFAWLRFAPGAPPIAVVSNFTPVPRAGYRIGLPFPGSWREVLNTDAAGYGGGGLGNHGAVEAKATPSHGFPASAEILAPPLATVYFEWQPE